MQVICISTTQHHLVFESISLANAHPKTPIFAFTRSVCRFRLSAKTFKFNPANGGTDR